MGGTHSQDTVPFSGDVPWCETCSDTSATRLEMIRSRPGSTGSMWRTRVVGAFARAGSAPPSLTFLKGLQGSCGELSGYSETGARPGDQDPRPVWSGIWSVFHALIFSPPLVAVVVPVQESTRLCRQLEPDLPEPSSGTPPTFSWPNGIRTPPGLSHPRPVHLTDCRTVSGAYGHRSTPPVVVPYPGPQTNVASAAFLASSSRSKIAAAGVAPGASRVTESSRASRCSSSLAGVATPCIPPSSTISPLR
jgi:hypothetical protein